MKLGQEEQKTQPTPQRPSPIRAFASTAVLVAGLIFGCQDQPAPKNLEVKCAPCPKCVMPAEATILKTGSAIDAPGIVRVSITENEDGSVRAAISGSVAQYAYVGERMDFTVKPGDRCVVMFSGNEVFDVYQPAVFSAGTKIAYPSSERVPRAL